MQNCKLKEDLAIGNFAKENDRQRKGGVRHELEALYGHDFVLEDKSEKSLLVKIYILEILMEMFISKWDHMLTRNSLYKVKLMENKIKK